MRSLHAFGPILGLAVCLLAPTAAVNTAGQPKLNILVLFADDMRAHAIAAYGNPYIKTPNIDALVSAGFSFRGHYVFGGNSGAVCVPRS
jgi:Sulfatase